MYTGVRLEHRVGFASNEIEGMKRLCLLCSACRIPTAVVGTWIRCGHCDKALLFLISRNYSIDLRSGLCTLQQQKPRKASDGLESCLQDEVESEHGDSPAKNSNIGGKRMEICHGLQPSRGPGSCEYHPTGTRHCP